MNQYNQSISNIIKKGEDLSIEETSKEEIIEEKLPLEPISKPEFKIGDIVSWTEKSGENTGAVEKIKQKVLSVKDKSGTLKNIPKNTPQFIFHFSPFLLILYLVYIRLLDKC